MTLYLTALLLATLLSAGLFPSPGPQPDRPNILWIVSEDNSPLIGCYGSTVATMSNIDRMAAKPAYSMGQGVAQGKIKRANYDVRAAERLLAKAHD